MTPAAVHNARVSSHADLTLAAWLTLSDEAAGRVAAAIARDTGARLTGVAPHTYAGRAARTAFFDRDGIRYALVPGGAAQLGHDPERFVPSARQRAAFAAAGLPGTIGGFVAGTTSPPRRVTLPASLVAVQSEEADVLAASDGEDLDDHAALMAALERRGLRPPTPDEWEYACGAGATTLFRWGDDHPDGDPYGDVPLLREPTLFGLIIGDDPYRAEFTTDAAVLCGGDGGSALCGDYGSFAAWLTLATAYRDADLADVVRDGELIGETPVRPVLPLA